MAIDTNAVVNVSATVSQRSSDDTSSASYQAAPAYSKTYQSGIITGTVNQVFSQTGSLSSGGSINYNLASLSESLLGNSIVKAFTGVSVLQLINLSNRPNFNITVNVNSSSGFRQPFGYPTGSMTLNPNSCIFVNSAGNLYPVNASNRQIQLVDSGSGARYSICIAGQ